MKTAHPDATRACDPEADKHDVCDTERSNPRSDALTWKTPEKSDKQTGIQAWWSSHANRNNW